MHTQAVRCAFALVAALSVSACMVTQAPIPSGLVVSAEPSLVYRLSAPVTVSAASAENMLLREGTTWMRTGSIPQGDVFHTQDQVVIVNSFHVFEADIVVKDEKVVGYFNPVGRSFVAARPAHIRFIVGENRK